MSKIWLSAMAVGALLASVPSSAMAEDSPTVEQLQQRINELQQTVGSLKSELGDNWLTERRADEIRALVTDVLADADTRASLLNSGLNAGWDKKFFLESADGNFRLNIEGQIQARYVYNNSDGGFNSNPAGQTADIDSELEDVYDVDIVGQYTGAIITARGLMGADLAAFNDALADAAMDNSLDSFLHNQIVTLTESQQSEFINNIVDGMANPVFSSFDEYASAVQAAFGAAVYDEAKADGDNDNDRWGFEMRRTKLKFSGHVVDPSWKYSIAGAFDRGGGEFILEDAVITKDFGNGWAMRMGQFKPPFMREELVSSSRQLAAERSLVNEFFNQDRSIGAEINYKADVFNFAAMYHNGFNGDNQSALAYDTEFAITGRAELLLAGSWGQFKDFTSEVGSDFGAMIGLAAHFEREEFGTGEPLWAIPVNDEIDDFRLTADVSLEGDRWNLFGAFIYRNLDSDSSDLDQYGFVVHGGFCVTDDIELFARYEYADFDLGDITFGGTTVYSFDDLSVITFGVNKYFSRHQLKWTTDIGIGLERVEFFADSSGAGYRSDTGGDDGQIVLRTQFQLLF